MSISPSDFLYALRNEACRVIEELKPVLNKANSLYERLDRIAEDCEDAASLVAASDIEPSKIATVPERSGLTRIMDILAYYQCRETNPKADHPRMGYHAFSEEQRKFLQEIKREAAEEVNRWHDSEMRKAEKQAWDAKEQAWDEGFNAGWVEAKDPGPFVNDVRDAKIPNPYRKTGDTK